MTEPCRADLACCRNAGHSGEHLYPTVDGVTVEPQPRPVPMTPRDALATALQSKDSTLAWHMRRSGRVNIIFWEQEADRILAALPPDAAIVTTETLAEAHHAHMCTGDHPLTDCKNLSEKSVTGWAAAIIKAVRGE